MVASNSKPKIGPTNLLQKAMACLKPPVKEKRAPRFSTILNEVIPCCVQPVELTPEEYKAACKKAQTAYESAKWRMPQRWASTLLCSPAK